MGHPVLTWILENQNLTQVLAGVLFPYRCSYRRAPLEVQCFTIESYWFLEDTGIRSLGPSVRIALLYGVSI